MSVESQAAQRLEDAADRLEKDGWHQGGYAPPAPGFEDGQPMPGGTPRCAVGALYGELVWNADVEDWLPRESPSQVLPAICYLTQIVYHGLNRVRETIPDWNDAPGRTAQEVLDALRLAAKQARMDAEAEQP